MIIRTLLVAIAMFTFANVASAAGFKVKNCEPVAETAVRKAHGFVSSNLTALFNGMTFLTAKQRDEMKRKWSRMTVDCIDRKPVCFKKQNLNGRSHGGVGNEVNLCYFNRVDRGEKICDLVGTMVHEEGHANGMPSMKGHNNPTPTIRAQDTVYRMGSHASSFCRTKASAGQFANTTLAGRSSLAIGKSCGVDDQCKTGKCQKGKCVCKRDADCGNASQWNCKKPIGKTNYCKKR
ncbi:MAG: hypothetical protein R3E48_04345 [Burkholderiaceae bacterium]